MCFPKSAGEEMSSWTTVMPILCLFVCLFICVCVCSYVLGDLDVVLYFCSFFCLFVCECAQYMCYSTVDLVNSVCGETIWSSPGEGLVPYCSSYIAERASAWVCTFGRKRTSGGGAEPNTRPENLEA